MASLFPSVLRFFLPIIVIVVSFSYSSTLGMGLILVWVLYLLYTKRADIYTLIARVKYTREGMDAALIWFKKAHESCKARPEQSILYSYLLLKGGNIDEAEGIMNEILKSKINRSDEMLVKSNLALVLWKRGRLDEAVELLYNIYNDFKTSNIYGSLGYLLILKGDMQKALEFNLEAYEYNSSNSIILDNLGQTYYMTGEYSKAEELYEKLMKDNPTFPEAYCNYSLVLLKQGDVQKALNTMKKALNYELSFLSAVTKEEINSNIATLEELSNNRKI